MKLLSLANRYYFFTLTIVFAIGGLSAYFILKSAINREFNRKLMAEREQLVYELHNFDDIKENFYLNIGDRIELKEVSSDISLPVELVDTVMYDDYEKASLPFRKLIFYDKWHGVNYRVTITKSLLPNEDLIEALTEIMIGLFVTLVFSLIVINRYVSRSIWSSFYEMIERIKKFNLSHPEQIKIPESKIMEFRELKAVLDAMIKKNIDDYQNLKEYTENTSHEIQTPLAIIKNKAELLLQEDFTEKQMNEIAKIYEAATRLSRLKEALAILSKIENNQYFSSDPIDLQQFLQKKLEHFEDLIEFKKLKVITNYKAQPVLNLNYDLAYMLTANLINNAIKHNIEGGQITITLTEATLTIENTGNELKEAPRELFGRFKRDSVKTDSTGLGLALVKRIVDLYDMKIQYIYNNRKHRIVLTFGQ